MPSDVLYTIGYERTDIESFLAALKAAGVELVIDVREAPISRKADFGKNKLAAHLERAGIAYRHLRSLGTPKQGREAAKAGDRATFWRVFEAHMRGEAAAEGLAEASALVREQACCLLCLERDHAQCHRSDVAGRIAARTGQEIVHLTVGGDVRQAAFL